MPVAAEIPLRISGSYQERSLECTMVLGRIVLILTRFRLGGLAHDVRQFEICKFVSNNR